MTGLFTIQPIRAGGSTIQPEVLASIQQASANTGVDFSYLMAQASRESSFDPGAAATTSSASGLYQFVEQTWLGTFKDHAADYGYGNLAAAINKQPDGHYTVSNPAIRKEILGLRKDPGLNAGMAAELASDNKAKMEKTLHRPVTATDLHLAHFLGLSGSLKFIRKLDSDPSVTGAAMFPKAAAANASVFYDGNGQARTIGDIYAQMNEKMNTDQAAFASLSTTPAGSMSAGAPTPSLVASAGSSVAGGNSLHGFSNPGGILSPLMLITIAALPTAKDQDEEGANAAHHGAVRASRHIAEQLNPLDSMG
jgi:hypothetical protein